MNAKVYEYPSDLVEPIGLAGVLLFTSEAWAAAQDETCAEDPVQHINLGAPGYEARALQDPDLLYALDEALALFG
ncbi:MAG: hypothetical protein H6739_42265 [Alphaproteobacteria bacterium]|nr:hypothetical protein [Alphaproteobacteria bacterium]